MGIIRGFTNHTVVLTYRNLGKKLSYNEIELHIIDMKVDTVTIATSNKPTKRLKLLEQTDQSQNEDQQEKKYGSFRR